LAIVLSVLLRFMADDYLFGILRLSLIKTYIHVSLFRVYDTFLK